MKDLVQPSNANIILVSDLRSAAREWIKDIEAQSKEIDHAASYHPGSSDWIEIFFNLDEKKEIILRKTLELSKD